MATVQTIDVNRLHQLMEQKPDLHLFDVRTPAEFAMVHAIGAQSSPLAELHKKQFAGLSGPLYLICKAGGRSRQAAELLLKQGHTEVINVDGGTDAWIAAAFPVQRGQRKVLPLDRQMLLTAGLIIVTGAILGTWVNHWGYAICAFVGLGLTMAGLTGFCPMAILISKMPWNADLSCSTGSCCAPKK